MENLAGRVALVTGSSQGLGRVIAKTLAQAGCHVVVNTVAGAEQVQAVVDEIRAAGGRATARLFDVADEAAVAAGFAGLEAELGGVDILVNNARIDPWSRPPEMTEGQWWDRVLGVNLKGAFLCSQEFFRRAQSRRWGRIINISSVRALIPAEMHTIAYGVSKAGMHSLTRTFAQNGAPFNITANSVAPGMILTENIDRRLSPEMKAKETARIPLGRGGSCEEVADAVLFVARNGYVTGETLHINGGMYYAP